MARHIFIIPSEGGAREGACDSIAGLWAGLHNSSGRGSISQKPAGQGHRFRDTMEADAGKYGRIPKSSLVISYYFLWFHIIDYWLLAGSVPSQRTSTEQRCWFHNLCPQGCGSTQVIQRASFKDVHLCLTAGFPSIPRLPVQKCWWMLMNAGSHQISQPRFLTRCLEDGVIVSVASGNQLHVGMHKPSSLATTPAWNQKSIQELGSAQGEGARARDGSAHESQNRWLAVVFLGFAMVWHGRFQLGYVGSNISILFKRPPERTSKPKNLARCNLPWQIAWLHCATSRLPWLARPWLPSTVAMVGPKRQPIWVETACAKKSRAIAEPESM